MLSKKTKYGIRSLIFLARHGPKGPALINTIATEEHIPRKYLELILLELKNDGVLESKPGKGGGYHLKRPPEAIKLSQIIRLLDGPIALVPCVSHTAYTSCDDCPGENKCAIRGVMKKVHDATLKVLDQTTLEDLMREHNRLNAIGDELEIHI